MMTNGLEMKLTKTDIQIRFADIDMLRHVNNVNLQHYFDVGKNDFFREFLNLGIAWDEQGLITVSTQTSYMEQTRYDARIYVETVCEMLGNKSITMFQRIINHETGVVHAESRTVLVCYNFERQESILIPEEWRVKLGM